MKYRQLLFLVALTILVSCQDDDVSPMDDITPPAGYSLIWNDEFNDGAINPENWTFQTGDGTDYGLPAGWGNNELQTYTSNVLNARIGKDGNSSSLIITAVDEGANEFTSARLVTKGLASVRFGRVDVRARMPEGQGIWPAIWMLGDNIDLIDWPGCGEIDIAELLGNDPSVYYSTVHFTNGENKHEEIQESYMLPSGSFSDAYHVFSVDWTPDEITFLLDDQQIQKIPIEDDMKEFLRSFYMVLNVAVGGYWPGNPDNTTVFPQSMAVDYVRIFYKDGFAPENPPELDIEEETVGQPIQPNIGDNAIRDDFTFLGNLMVVSYGGGGEPVVSASATAIDGDSSLRFDYPGGTWGGAYLELEETRNLTPYKSLKFSITKPATMINAEIKLESPASNHSVFLKDYTPAQVADGFLEYTIPLSDFSNLDLSQVSIPFAFWNPQDSGENFTGGTVLIDNLYFTE